MSANKVLAAFASPLIRSTAAVRMDIARAYSGGIREAGGGFAKREIAEEERYAHEQELISIRKLKADLIKRETALANKIGVPVEATADAASDTFSSTNPDAFGSTGAHSSYAGGGSIGKRGAAAEEKYVREHDAERIHKLQDHLKK
ncbi:hypothetical protein BASA50_003444 [Batrachochytrium salamandrivorans]|uniref:ATPase inhibitor, mitochondrial n=1 Tax=Batrachochytrium salamandrivorans TaxID=1357716 RepID=A0ABQ8FIS2_9FUNG|nr:hypothetical protein BASA60_007539 [Batrachochytrium salamandrivorans]KAH6580728.1 hypothetical protein BASA61_009464 [Batrachochytrium salamandrivorans]KAH6598937.1 hypothetical protein BASA50_003444 [Batrachochytrium salamandrivorans]KAH9245666.1 hypothetical protein BASA81_016830 [Batrachochytrium salamandrivorans]KAH9273625.1 hypothetical protein BASA83_003956 [Batrachochytrium salamandrivorans]